MVDKCECLTVKGTRCKRNAMKFSSYCAVHKECATPIKKAPKSKTIIYKKKVSVAGAKAKAKTKAKAKAKVKGDRILSIGSTTNVEVLEVLPRDTLYEILMNTPSQDLKNLCATSTVIAKICRDSVFQTNYKSKWPISPNFLKQYLLHGGNNIIHARMVVDEGIVDAFRSGTKILSIMTTEDVIIISARKGYVGKNSRMWTIKIILDPVNILIETPESVDYLKFITNGKINPRPSAKTIKLLKDLGIADELKNLSSDSVLGYFRRVVNNLAKIPIQQIKVNKVFLPDTIIGEI